MRDRDPVIKTEFPRRLNEVKGALECTDAQLGRCMGVHPKTLCDWRKSKQPTDFATTVVDALWSRKESWTYAQKQEAKRRLTFRESGEALAILLR